MNTGTLSAVQLAICYLKLKKYAEAEELINQQVNFPASKELQQLLGLTYALRNDYDSAIRAFESQMFNAEGKPQANELVFALLINKAQKALAEKNHTALSDTLNSALKVMPNENKFRMAISHFENVLPISHIKDGDREKAADLWAKEIKPGSSSLNVIHNLALLYYYWALSVENELLEQSLSNKDEFRAKANYLWNQAFIYWNSFVYSQSFWELLCAEKSASWGCVVSMDDVKGLRNSISETQFVKVLEDYLEQFKGKNQEDAVRIKNYLIDFHFERQTSRYFQEFLEVISRNKKKINTDLLKNANEILSIKEPFTLSFIKKHFPNDKLIEKIISITGIRFKSDLDNKVSESIRIACKFPTFSKIIISVSEFKDFETATYLWEKMQSKEGEKVSAAIMKTAEAQYVKALMSFVKGSQLNSTGEIKLALKEWQHSFQLITVKGKKDTDETCITLISDLSLQLKATVGEECLKSGKELNSAGKLDEAIEVLLQGHEMSGNESVRDLLCSNYCEKAHTYLKEKKFDSANTLFEKALKINKNYKTALTGLSISKNNEGMAAMNNDNYDRAITLLEESLRLDRDDVVAENLARALNYKAVQIVNGLSEYSSSSTCDLAVSLLSRGLKLLNEKLDTDSLSGTLAYYEEFMFNNLVGDIEDGIYKTMLRNFWIAVKSRRNIRGY